LERPQSNSAITEADLVSHLIDERKLAIDLHLPDRRQRFGAVFGRMERYFVALTGLAQPAIPNRFRISSVTVPTSAAFPLRPETICHISIVVSIATHLRKECADLFIRAIEALSSAQHIIQKQTHSHLGSAEGCAIDSFYRLQQAFVHDESPRSRWPVRKKTILWTVDP
jgi:hypothetical protein